MEDEVKLNLQQIRDHLSDTVLDPSSIEQLCSVQTTVEMLKQFTATSSKAANDEMYKLTLGLSQQIEQWLLAEKNKTESTRSLLEEFNSELTSQPFSFPIEKAAVDSKYSVTMPPQQLKKYNQTTVHRPDFPKRNLDIIDSGDSTKAKYHHDAVPGLKQLTPLSQCRPSKVPDGSNTKAKQQTPNDPGKSGHSESKKYDRATLMALKLQPLSLVRPYRILNLPDVVLKVARLEELKPPLVAPSEIRNMFLPGRDPFTPVYSNSAGLKTNATSKAQRTYKCNVCKTKPSQPKQMLEHILGTAHRKNCQCNLSKFNNDEKAWASWSSAPTVKNIHEVIVAPTSKPDDLQSWIEVNSSHPIVYCEHIEEHSNKRRPPIILDI